MKTLYIVRHAKSSWEDPGLSDHDRPLLPVGERKTKRIVKFLQQRDISPDLMLSSSAARAYETAKIIAEGIGYPSDKIVRSSGMYHASSDEIYSELFSLPDEVNSVMVFGHNPTLTYFSNYFVSPTIENLPTSGIVSISFDCNSWEEISNSSFHVNFVVTPKMLK